MEESPPCVWGVPRYPLLPRLKSRITPMCMGSTEPRSNLMMSLGESPPCVWGVLATSSMFAPLSRITPMCMGSTVKIT